MGFPIPGTDKSMSWGETTSWARTECAGGQAVVYPDDQDAFPSVECLFVLVLKPCIAGF